MEDNNNSNNIKLKSNFEKRFREIENELKDSHIGLDEEFYSSINETIGCGKLIRLSKTIYIATSNNIDKEKESQQHQIYTTQEYELGLEIDDIHNKLIFFSSNYLWVNQKHINSLLKIYSINKLVIYCSLSELAHISHPSNNNSINLKKKGVKDSGVSTFEKFKNQFINKMKSSFSNNHDSDTPSLPNISCDIIYFPLCYSQMFKNYFTIPIQNSFFPSNYFLNDIKLNEYKLNKMPESIQDDVHKTIHSMLSFLNELKLGSVSGEDLSIYPIGPFSNYLAHEIQTTLSTVTTQQQDDYHPISLILIDRNLDLVGPSLHSENSMDRIYYSTTTKSNQPIINIESFYDNLNKISSNSSVSECPKIISTITGSTTTTTTTTEDRVWDALIAKSLKDVIMILKRKLVEIISKENINVDIASIAGPINIQSLITLVNVLKNEDDGNGMLIYRYSDIIEAVASIEQTFNLSSQFHWDQLLSIEKILLLSSGYEDDDENSDDEYEDDEDENNKEPSILSQICDIIETPIGGDDKYYSINEVLILCVLAYSIKGLTSKLSQKHLNLLKSQINDEATTSISTPPQTTPTSNYSVKTLMEKVAVFSESDENRLIDCLTDKILKENKDFKQLQFLQDYSNQEEGEEEPLSEERLNEILREKVLSKLQSIAIIRQKYLNEHKSLIKGGSGSSSMMGSTYCSLLSQLIKSLFECGTSTTGGGIEIKDFEKYNSSSLVGYLLGKSTNWMSRVTSAASIKKKDKPLDNRKVIIYVLGGITFTETKEINDLLEKTLKSQPYKDQFSNHQFLIGSNQILTPLKLFNYLFNKK